MLKTRILHKRGTVKTHRRFSLYASDEAPRPEGRKIKIQYFVEGDTLPRVFKAWVNYDQNSIGMEEIKNLLVADKVNLRNISNIRYSSIIN
jgi:hypothetical protein